MGLSQRGSREAFTEIVARRQTWIRNLMRRCSGDAALADDLSQQVFLQAWKTIRHLQEPQKFAGWLKKVAINMWLQHARRNDPLVAADELQDATATSGDTTGIGMDLDAALAQLPEAVRMCIVLAYHERMTHDEIAGFTGIPVGTVKSHIRRGTKRLQETLSAYRAEETMEGAG